MCWKKIKIFFKIDNEVSDVNCIMTPKIGITIAGSIILDIVKSISGYPKSG